MVENDFSTTADNLIDVGLYPEDSRVYISLKDTHNILRRGLRWKFGEQARWLPEYNDVAEWLSDNKGRGLLMYGQCGRGKTVMGRYILPIIINCMCRKIVSCYTSQEMNQYADDVMKKHIIYLDDIGVENLHVEYGNKRIVFPEVVDSAEREGKLLIISTNLSLHEIKEKYGFRTADRLKVITRQVPFIGESLRK